MRLSFSVPLITGFVLIMTLFVNILWLGVFINELFPEYSSNVMAEINGTSTPNSNLLKVLITADTLDETTRLEYENIIGDLERYTSNLDDISKNPENYITPPDTVIAVSSESLTGGIEMSGEKILGGFRVLSSFFNNLGNPFNPITYEERFIRDILLRVIILNLVWIAIIFLSYFFWIRRLFRPIAVVTKNLRDILEQKKYTHIPYRKQDEFSPLTEMINTLNKSLSLQEKIRSDFLSDLSHEIRTPITTIRCYLEWIHDKVIEITPATLTLLDIELVRLTEITERIMNYEQFTNTSWNIHITHFSPRELTDAIIAGYQPQLLRSHQKIEVNISPNMDLLMNQDMFIQVLHNIFSNFLKYAGENTSLTFSIVQEKKYMILQFHDNGVGVSEEEIPYLMEKFYRVDKARTQKDGSMGIGLSIVEKIARLHGGKCEISHGSSGSGFQISVWIAR